MERRCYPFQYQCASCCFLNSVVGVPVMEILKPIPFEPTSWCQTKCCMRVVDIVEGEVEKLEPRIEMKNKK